MISDDAITIIGFALGSFGIGYVSGFLLLAFKKFVGILR